MQPTEEKYCENCGVTYRGRCCPNCTGDGSNLMAKIVVFILCVLFFGIVVYLICMQKKGRSDPEKLDELVNELSTFKGNEPAKKEKVNKKGKGTTPFYRDLE